MKVKLARAQALLNRKHPQPDLAIRMLQPLAEKNNAPWPVFHLLGVALIEKREYEKALEFLHAAQKKGSDDPVTLHSISLCHFHLGRFDQAEEWELKALELDPDYFKGWLHLGSIYRVQARLEEALSCFSRANQLDQKSHAVAYMIGEIFQAQGNLEKALGMYEITLKMDRTHTKALMARSEVLMQMHRHDEAEEGLYRVLEDQPLHVPARVMLAELFKNQGNYDKALELYERLIREHPRAGGIRSNYALCLQDLGRYSESEENYLRAFKDQPEIFHTLSNYLMGMHYNPERSKEEIFEAHLLWDEHFSPARRPERPVPANRRLDKKLRIGLISGGFRRHPVGWMITSALERLPEDQFEIYCYSTNSTHDEITRRIYEATDKWQSVIGYNDEVLASLIRSDEIDILVELCGHAADTRLKTVALEPAPVIVKWVGGLFNTTGLRSVDYLITDHVESPEGEDRWYTEKLVRMPDDYICYLPPDYAPEVGPLPALETGHVTFGCFNNPAKVNSRILEKWAEILKRVPGSRLFLKSRQYDTEALRKRILEVMRANGIPDDRVQFEGQSYHPELLECYNRVDIALDPWPYSGGLTTCEALWMGVPVITFPGPTFAGRHSATHLMNSRYPEWVTESWEEYVERAVDLADNLDLLAELRQTMRDQVKESPLCDGRRFGAHLAAAFREMWRHRVEGYEKGAAEGEWARPIEVEGLAEEEISSGSAKAVRRMPVQSENPGQDVFKHGDREMGRDIGTDAQPETLTNGIFTSGTTHETVRREPDAVESRQPETMRIPTTRNVTVCTPADLNLLTTYVLLEQGDWYEPELQFVQDWLKPGMTALDIGAGFGVYALSMARMTGRNGRVVAFEPGKVACYYLEMSKQENGLDQLEIVGRGVSERVGKAKMEIAGTPELNVIDPQGSEEISITTLDAWWEYEGRPTVHLIKLDVNGMEGACLAGAEKLLSETGPVLLLSVEGGGTGWDALAGSLNSYSYRLFEYIPGAGLLSPFEFGEGYDPYLMNLIAIKEAQLEEFRKDGLIHNDDFEPQDPAPGLWKEVLRGLPWTDDLIAGWKKRSLSPNNRTYLKALDYLCAAEAIDFDQSSTSRSEKAVLLIAAAELLIPLYMGGMKSTSLSLTLIRVMNALGRRSQSVEILQKLIEETKFGQENINLELPFLPPLPVQDGAEIRTDKEKWLMVRVLEAWILLKDITTYLSGEQERRLLEGLDGNPETIRDLHNPIDLSILIQPSSSTRRNYNEILRRVTGRLPVLQSIGSCPQARPSDAGMRGELPESVMEEVETNRIHTNGIHTNGIHTNRIISDSFWKAPVSARKAELAYSICKKIDNGLPEIKKQLIKECQRKLDHEGSDGFAFFILVNTLLSIGTRREESDESLWSRLESRDWIQKGHLYSYFFDRVVNFRSVREPECSVVVVSNRINDEVLKNLQEITRQKTEHTEVVFVSNGVEEEVVQQAIPYVDTLVYLRQNAGACMARNFGALFSNGEIIIFIDDDGIPEEGLIQAHLKIHKERAIHIARGVYRPKTKNGPKPWHYELGTEVRPAVCLLEGNTSFRPEAFFKVGGWNDRLLVYHEGLELSYRYFRAGYEQEKLIYFPDAVLRHDYVKPPAGQNRKNRLLKTSHYLIHAIHDDIDAVLNSWPDRFSGKPAKSPGVQKKYPHLKKLVYLSPGTSDMAYGLHNRRARAFHELTLKEGVESEIVELTDPHFLRKMVELSREPGHALYTGVMGYPSWVTIDRVTSANLFDLLEMNVFALIGDHLFADFMWQRLEKMGRRTIFYSYDKSLLEELETLGPGQNPSFVIEDSAPIIEIDPNKAQRRLDRREIDILIPWVLSSETADRSRLFRQLTRMGNKVRLVGEKLVESLDENRDDTVMHLFEDAFRSEMGGVYEFNRNKNREDYVWMNMLHLVDQHVRHHRRFRMLQGLVDVPDGKRIVITAGKNSVKGYGKILSKKNIEWVGRISIGELNKLYQKSKIVMNCNPTYPNILHGRVKSGMGWGCCIVSDRSPGLEARFEDRRSILFLNDKKTITDLVQDPSIQWQEIADNGRRIINKKYNMDSYCTSLLKKMNKYVGNRI